MADKEKTALSQAFEDWWLKKGYLFNPSQKYAAKIAFLDGAFTSKKIEEEECKEFFERAKLRSK